LLPQKLAGLMAGFLYKIWASTYRYQIEFEDETDRKIFYQDFGVRGPNPQKNLIYACFHQDDLSCLPYFGNQNITILISQSKDGQVLASASEYLGYLTVRGSSHRGGVAGLLAGMKKVQEGFSMTIAVDGPKGPIYQVKEGITAVSEKSKRPIVPVRGLPSKKIIFKKSWNRATLPLPFTKIKIKIGKIGFYSTQNLEAKMRSM
jgi:lysophospholipid acyltransferase (LPLAT)-like uncharacterized protein